MKRKRERERESVRKKDGNIKRVIDTVRKREKKYSCEQPEKPEKPDVNSSKMKWIINGKGRAIEKKRERMRKRKMKIRKRKRGEKCSTSIGL